MEECRSVYSPVTADDVVDELNGTKQSFDAPFNLDEPPTDLQDLPVALSQRPSLLIGGIITLASSAKV